MKTTSYRNTKDIKFFIRIDANKLIGYGHFYRTLVIAEKLKSEKVNVKYIFNKNSKIAKILKKKKIKFHQINCSNKNLVLEISEIRNLLKKQKKNKKIFLIIDHPYADTKYLKEAKNISDYLLVYAVDHLRKRYYFGDIIINQNYKASRNNIKAEKSALKLVGTKFILIRKNFLDLKKKYHKKNEIFANFGGSDNLDFSFKLLKLFESYIKNKQIKNIVLNIVVGPGYNNYNKLKKAAKRIKQIKVYNNPKNFNQIMVKSKMAIVAAGSICWELAYLKILGVVIAASKNQERVAQQLGNDKYFFNINKKKLLSPNLILNKVKFIFKNYQDTMKTNKNKFSKLVDGKGVERIFYNIQRLIIKKNLD